MLTLDFACWIITDFSYGQIERPNSSLLLKKEKSFQRTEF